MTALTPDLNRLFDAYTKQYSRQGIRLHRPFPPDFLKPGRSKFGGLPNLPLSQDWPIGRRLGRPIPMHFMVQIDFGELPRFGHKLPPAGMLFLFGCDIDMDWCAEDQNDDARVIYVPEVAASTPQRKPPPNMLPVGGEFPPGEWRLPGESGAVLHPEWPILPQRFTTFPDFPPVKDSKVYRDYVAGRREVELARLGAATGLPAQHVAYGPLIDLEGWRKGAVPFPSLGFTFNRLARYLMNQVVGAEKNTSSREAAIAARSTLSRLLDRSLEIGDADGVPTAENAALADWIQENDASHPRVQHYFDKALLDTIEHFAARPDVLQHLPRQLLDTARKRHDYLSYLPYDQMLGLARLSQDVQDPLGKDVCLLQLDRSEGGEITLWIDPRDLERRDFSRVQITARYG